MQELVNAPPLKCAYAMVESADLASKQRRLLSWTLHDLQSSVEPEVKTEANFLDVTEPAVSVDLQEDSSTVFWVLREVLYPTCALYDADFRELKSCMS